MKILGTEHSRGKGYRTGTHRTRPPAETVRDFGRWMSRLGITRIANVTGLDRIGIPVCQAIRPNARSLAVSQGKGLDVDSAKASALMESMEFWHAEHIVSPLRFDSYTHLRQVERVADVEGLPLRKGGVLRPDRPMLWIQGWDLMREEPSWLPFELVNMNTVTFPGTIMTFFAGTNGLASGNDILEAAAHALSELLERDAVALCRLENLAELAQRKIDLTSVVDPVCTSVLERFDRAGVEVAVWDFTCDTGVPTFMCAAVDRPDHPSASCTSPAFGYGAHLSPAVALCRALTEAAQSRLTLISGSRDDNPRHVYAEVRDEAQNRRFRENYMATRPVRPCPAGDGDATDSFEGDVRALLDALRRVGLSSACLVDLTQPDMGIPVVKAVVPGLEVDLHGARTGAQPGRRARAIMAKRAAP